MYKIKDHVGDVKFYIENKNLEVLFEDIANAFTKYVFASEKNAKELYQIKLKSKDIKTLIHDYIEELINIAFFEGLYFQNAGAYITEKEGIYYLLSNVATAKAFGKEYNVEVKACSFNISFGFDEKTKKYKTEFVLDL